MATLMGMQVRAWTLGLGIGLGLAGCTSAAQHQQQLGAAAERNMTVGVVQKAIHAGMPEDAVAAALGAPNIVTRDAAGHETWIYDKVASEASYSQSEAYGTILVLGAGQAAGATASTQRTLTVIIKFAADRTVETFSYHASEF